MLKFQVYQHIKAKKRTARAVFTKFYCFQKLNIIVYPTKHTAKPFADGPIAFSFIESKQF